MYLQCKRIINDESIEAFLQNLYQYDWDTINLFQANSPILYPQKTPVISEGIKWEHGEKWVKTHQDTLFFY